MKKYGPIAKKEIRALYPYFLALVVAIVALIITLAVLALVTFNDLITEAIQKDFFR